ncbi:MAG: hypothetical protein LBD59_00415 [Prevotellaceae bacterium]|nr:hypothetical protein [Prevotellaceae bacterium]
MRKFRFYFFTLAAAGMLFATSCVDNTESESVGKIRNAKTDELKAEAALKNAEAAAKGVLAAADAAYKNAQADVLKADAAYKTAEIAIIAADIKQKEAQAELTKAQAKYQEGQAEYILAQAEVQKAMAAINQANADAQVIDNAYQTAIQAGKIALELEKQKVEVERQKTLLAKEATNYQLALNAKEAALRAAEQAEQAWKVQQEGFAAQLADAKLQAELALAQLKLTELDAKANIDAQLQNKIDYWITLLNAISSNTVSIASYEIEVKYYEYRIASAKLDMERDTLTTRKDLEKTIVDRQADLTAAEGALAFWQAFDVEQLQQNIDDQKVAIAALKQQKADAYDEYQDANKIAITASRTYNKARAEWNGGIYDDPETGTSDTIPSGYKSDSLEYWYYQYEIVNADGTITFSPTYSRWTYYSVNGESLSHYYGTAPAQSKAKLETIRDLLNSDINNYYSKYPAAYEKAIADTLPALNKRKAELLAIETGWANAVSAWLANVVKVAGKTTITATDSISFRKADSALYYWHAIRYDSIVADGTPVGTSLFSFPYGNLTYYTYTGPAPSGTNIVYDLSQWRTKISGAPYNSKEVTSADWLSAAQGKYNQVYNVVTSLQSSLLTAKNNLNGYKAQLVGINELLARYNTGIQYVNAIDIALKDYQAKQEIADAKDKIYTDFNALITEAEGILSDLDIIEVLYDVNYQPNSDHESITRTVAQIKTNISNAENNVKNLQTSLKIAENNLAKYNTDPLRYLGQSNYLASYQSEIERYKGYIANLQYKNVELQKQADALKSYIDAASN